MKYLKHIVVILFVIPCSLKAQNNSDDSLILNNYGVDQTNKIIVWNSKKPINSLAYNTSNNSIVFNNITYTFLEKPSDLVTTESYLLLKGKDTFRLYITPLPVLNITSSKPIVDEPKITAKLKYSSPEQNIEATIGIELRGNSSLAYPKKSYDLEIWKDTTNKESIDVKFDDLRNDDDWILNSLYNEPLRIRSFFSNKLWLKLYKLYYTQNEPSAKSGIDLMYTEVFLNNKYLGIYSLMEQVDRKLLSLKEFTNDNVRGALFKASSYKGATSFKEAPDFKNIFPHWGGYEMIYPYENFEAHWGGLYEFIDFVANATDVSFKKEIADRFDLHNAIDYFIFINLIRATDNLGKNFYIVNYDSKTPYFIVPWDLDGVLGIIQDGKRIATTNDILSNGLFDRLLKLNPDNYRKKLKERWTMLRSEEFSDELLLNTLDESVIYFEENKIYEREFMVWSQQTTRKDDVNYLKEWLRERLKYLDSYFDNL